MIAGTAGHIDHGKTALIRKLTGIDTDRLKEEKARGISIDLGFAYWPRPNGAVVGFVDVPGHERLVHNMLAGATGIDFVILVIAADDGVMPQTREHLAIMNLLGLGRGTVALSKCDLADAGRLAQVTDEIEALLEDTGLRGSEIIPVSAVTGTGLGLLAERIDAAIGTCTVRSREGRFRLAVDRSFTLAGHGATVTGTVLSGSVRAGDRVIVSPSGLEARVRSVHAQNRPAERGEAGQRCALVLSGPRITGETIRRGQMILDPDLHAPASRIDASLRLLPSEPREVGQWFPVKVHHAAAEVPGRIVVLSGDTVRPGETGLIQLVLERPLAAAAGDRFVVRDTSSSRTLGGGVFIDLRAPERRRRTPGRLARIEALAENAPAAALAKSLDGSHAWIDLGAFIRDRALAGEAQANLSAKLGLVNFPRPAGDIVMLEAGWRALSSELGDGVDAFHAANPDLPGIGLEQLRRALSLRLPTPLFTAALKKFAEPGEVVLDRMWVRRPHHTVKFSAGEEQLLADFLCRLDAAPYRPPRVRDIANAMDVAEDAVRRLLRMSARRGEADELAHDHFFTRSAVEAMARIAIELGEQSPAGSFSAADFRDRLGNGRKVAIQILEFFDRHGFTIRRKDLRRINPAHAGLFASGQASGQGGPVEKEESRSRWGGRTSNPDGAAGRP